MNNEELNINFLEMSDDDLYALKKKLEQAYAKLCSDRALDLRRIDGDNFDPFTFMGKKKVEAITKRYAELDDGYMFLMEELLREFKRRQISLVDIEQSESLEISDEEYIAKAIEKNKEFQVRKNIEE